MTNVEIIQAIKVEVERLYNGEAPKHDQQCNFDDGYFVGIDAIAQFLDSLESENPNQDELEEEIERYLPKIPENPYNEELRVFARHFAQWQYQKDRGEFAKFKAKTWSEGFNDCKQQMLKDAVKGTVYGTENYKWVESNILENIEEKGDKVKLIIVKEND